MEPELLAIDPESVCVMSAVLAGAVRDLPFHSTTFLGESFSCS